ncbi:N-acetyl-gamma-glutamyl-phosphate reductase [Glaciecola sp. 2405UD65-10]|uniref:N-acetyl-gamma-glutamyl-phosphate reductase n=1 Tax=Glaciecola sp. 2405UD65-10 TaxID=3397244 RepID=UPI003B5CDB50
MKKTCIVGASGYTGAELIKIISRHPQLNLETCFVSDGSQYAGKSASEVHPELQFICDLPLVELTPEKLASIKDDFDIVFLATPHEFSHDKLPSMLGARAKVFDLSGAYRLQNTADFAHFYGFAHLHPNSLSKAVYGLAEWYESDIANAAFVAVPGCYPTASLLALKPLLENNLLNTAHLPVINATSGVSGAGKKASMTSSFYEVSLQAYGVLSHRHTPEIEAYANNPVIFTPHLGAFKRGILATLTAFTNSNVSEQDIQQAYEKAYKNSPLIRLRNTMPKVDQVTNTPFCDIGFAYDPAKKCIVVTSAIDNLLKGASSQAIQCCNIALGIDQTTGLL